MRSIEATLRNRAVVILCTAVAPSWFVQGRSSISYGAEPTRIDRVPPSRITSSTPDDRRRLPVDLRFTSARFAPTPGAGDLTEDGAGGWFSPEPVNREENPRRWHIDLALRTSHTKLSKTEQLLDRRLDWPLKADILNVFHRPRTAIDRKSAFGLNSLYIGIGRQENDRWAWTAYAGGIVASDKMHQRFLIANLSIRFRYALYYAGAGTEFYPWGAPRPPPEDTWSKRLRNSRPFVFTGFEIGYIRSEGAGRYALAPITLYRDREHIRDWIFSYKLGIGWDIPLDAHWSLTLAGDYSFHFYLPEEYNSWNLITGLRYRL